MPTDRATLITATIDNIPSLPAIVTRVLQITSDPESSADELMEVISADPAYTVKILKLANSAFYGRAREIATLRQAVMVIGFAGIRNLVLASAVFNNFRQIKKVADFDAIAFWRHAFLTGLGARMIARQLQQQDGELFVAGLIHDVGKLAILMALPEEFGKIAKMTGNRGRENIIAEQHLFGITHAQVGVRLFRRWMFPDILVMATQYHHESDLSAKVYAGALVVHLADLLAHTVANANRQDAPFPPECFSAETATSARAHGLVWDMANVRQMAAQLGTEMETQAGMLATLLSGD